MASLDEGALGVVDASGVSGDELAIAAVFVDGAACEPGAVEPVQLNRLVPVPVEAQASPAYVEVGVDCGMPDMCGLDPCLCGTPDAWGACACNGLQEVAAEVAFASGDEGVVGVVEAFGRTWLVPRAAGEAEVTASAALSHREGASASFTVGVGGLTSADLGALGAGLVLLLGATALVAGLVRRVRRKGRGSAAGPGGGAEGPVVEPGEGTEEAAAPAAGAPVPAAHAPVTGASLDPPAANAAASPGDGRTA